MLAVLSRCPRPESMSVPEVRAPSASEVPHRLAGVPVLVGVNLLTYFDAEGL